MTDTSGSTPPFELRQTAWKLIVEDYPDLSNRNPSSKSLGNTLNHFYKVVTDDRDQHTRKQKVQRQKACNQAWVLLTQEMQRSKELRDPLMIARAYVSTECSFPRKSLPHLRLFTRRNKSTDPLFYEGHFWLAETLLEMDQGKAALTHYRWVLGEIEADLYPLALLRTAHCHWDAENVEEAREYLRHVDDWIGNKTSPVWVRSLKQQVSRDLSDFTD